MDALILGAWTQPAHANSILDVGTGSGIIALMLASKSTAEITGLDIDKDSVNEAQLNFSNSVYKRRMSAKCCDFVAFSGTTKERFDLVVSNPPYFVNDKRSENQKKRQARHADTLSYDQLIAGVESLLTRNGKFNVILPYDESFLFLKGTEKSDLFLVNQLIIFPRRGGQPNRIILQFSREKVTRADEEKLAIREEDDYYSAAFNILLKDFLIGQGYS